MVSVIIPNFNRENLIFRAVTSVLNQTYQNIEVIVVDDCSTDRSLTVLDKIRDSRLRLFKLEKNSGACVARNKGIEVAKGKYISFLDSDDEWLPDKLERQLDILEKKGYDAVFTQYYYYALHNKEDRYEIRPCLKKGSSYLSNILYANCVAMDTLLARKEIFNEIKFDVKLPRYQDWDIAIQIAKKFRLAFLEKPTLNVYEQMNSITYSTSKEKKYMAIRYLYEKYQDLIIQYQEAQAHFLWTMGMYSYCVENGNMNYIKQSISLDKKNLKKRAVYFVIKIGGGKMIGRLYAKNH